MPLLLCVIGMAVLYGLSLNRLPDIKLYHKQPRFFFLSLGLLYVTIGSPLTTISHLSFSLHMMQMSILYFIIPPLLLVGIPNQLFQRIRKTAIAGRIGKWILTPKIALIIFAVMFLMYHLPVVLHVFTQNPFVHNGYIYLLFLLSFSMWWPIVSPDPKQRLGDGQKKQYVFLSGVLLMPACLLFVISALLDGANNPFLTQITALLCMPSQSISIHILPTPFNTKYDQAMAGFLMLGIHKMSLMATARLGADRSDTQIEKGDS
nr:cytochrome c oxidase assembly protein [Cytobacillus eiseniae]